MRKQDKSTIVTEEEGNKRRAWILFNAKGKTLGRFASEITKVLRGKHRPDFTPNADCGDGVIIINAKEIALTGDKEVKKMYRYYTGHIGGERYVPFETMKARNPTYILEHAVKGMMPKTRLANKQLKRLRIFAGSEHNMDAQTPVVAAV